MWLEKFRTLDINAYIVMQVKTLALKGQELRTEGPGWNQISNEWEKKLHPLLQNTTTNFIAAWFYQSWKTQVLELCP